MNRLLMTMLGFGFAVSTAFAEPMPKYAESSINSLRNATADYVQTKVLSQGVKLKSSGSVSLSDTKGLAWVQKQPFLQTVLIDDKVIKLQTQSESPQIIEASRSPEVYKVIATLKSLFEGRENSLSKEFEISFSGEPSAWNLLLRPKNEPLSKIIQSIEIKGDQRLESVYLIECSGAKTLIQFGEIRPLSKNDQKNFEFSK